MILCFDAVDVSDPTQPTVVGGTPQGVNIKAGLYASWGGDYNQVGVAGDRLWVSHRWGGVFMLDLSDPHEPTPMGMGTDHSVRLGVLAWRPIAESTHASQPTR